MNHAILYGWVLGILPSIVSFFISNRSDWRNYFTKEFTVCISLDVALHDNEKKFTLKEMPIHCTINCKNGEELMVNRIYFKLPDNIKGNRPAEPTKAEALFVPRGKYYMPELPFRFKHSWSKSFNLKRENDQRIFDEIEAKNLKEINFVVETSKYGKVKSNSISLSRNNVL